MTEHVPIYKKVWFWLFIVFLALPYYGLAIFGMVYAGFAVSETDSPSAVQQQVPSQDLTEIGEDEGLRDELGQSGTEEKNTAAAALGLEASIEEKQQLYINEVQPWRNDIVTVFNEAWQSNWADVMMNMNNGTINADQAIKELTELNTVHFGPLLQYVTDYKIPEGFSAQEASQIQSFQEKMAATIQVRMTAAEDVIQMLEGTIPFDGNAAAKTITDGDSHMIQGFDDLTALEKSLQLYQ